MPGGIDLEKQKGGEVELVCAKAGGEGIDLEPARKWW